MISVGGLSRLDLRTHLVEPEASVRNAAGAEPPAATVRHTDSLRNGSDVVTDGGGSEFVNHRRRLLKLPGRAASRDNSVVLRGMPQVAGRFGKLREVSNTRVEEVA